MMTDAMEKSSKRRWLRALLGLLISQFLGAFNDNVYKIVLSLLAANQALATGEGSSAIAIIGAIFILPFFLFSGYAGYVADVFSKRTVLITTKCLEIVSMGLGIFAFLAGQLPLMLGVLFLMALQSTFFSPAKYGILPELLPDRDLSRANGLMEMGTFLAIILGTSIGSFLFATWNDQLERVGLVLLGLAIVGSLTSLTIPAVPASGSQKSFPLNPWAEIAHGLKRLTHEKVLWLAALGSAYFWFLGALLQMDLILLGKEVMHLNDTQVGLLATFLAIGIGTGSLAAGRLSGDTVELGLVPLGSIGMGIFSLLLSGSASSYAQTAAMLVGLGFSGGLFIIPLQAFLQQKSGAQEKGRVLATTNFLTTVGILIASGALWLLRDFLGIQADTIIALSGVCTFGATAYLLSSLPDFRIRCYLWLHGKKTECRMLLRRLVFSTLSILVLTLSPVAPVASASSTSPALTEETENVIVLHGLGRTRRSMRTMEKALTQRGYRVFNIGYPSTTKAIPDLAAELHVQVQHCCHTNQTHFVTHSLGGILVRSYLTHYPLDNLGRVVMLSPPNKGSELVDVLGKVGAFTFILGPASGQLSTQPSGIPNQLNQRGPVDFELGVITGNRSFNPLTSWLIPGPDDGRVSVNSAQVAGMADFLVVPRTHTFIMSSQTVIEQTVNFLRTGKFERL